MTVRLAIVRAVTVAQLVEHALFAHYALWESYRRQVRGNEDDSVLLPLGTDYRKAFLLATTNLRETRSDNVRDGPIHPATSA